MVKLSKLYTKNGDDGKNRVTKHDIQVEAYGTVDELNSLLGVISAYLLEKDIREDQALIVVVQQELFDIGAELATPHDSEWKPPSQITTADIERLEKDIDRWTDVVPELKSFLLPGGSQLTGTIHLARTVCRRAERVVSQFSEKQETRSELLIYLNRLSDWLFALARKTAHEQGEKEVLWDAERKAKK